MRKYLQSQQQEEQINQEGKYTIGPFVFTKPLPLQLSRNLRHLYRNYKNKIDTLRIQNERLEQLIPSQVLQVADSFQIQHLQKLHMANNKMYSISFLSKCYFPNLLVINLSRNRLWSLTEIGNHLHFPNLQQLYLHNNHINSIRGIKRWSLPHLTKLTFDLNFIVSIQELPQTNLPALREFLIYSNQIADFRVIFKSFFPKLQNLQVHENSSRDQIITFSILSTKFIFLQAGSLFGI